jgi:hypothetical protein
MNRRQLLATVATILAEPAVRRDELTAAEIAPTGDAGPALIVLTAPGALRWDTVQLLTETLRDANPWPNTKIAVLPDGLAVHVFDRQGRVIGATPIARAKRRAKTAAK